MENDLNKILATKRDWRKAERRKADRRVKDGTPDERKDLAGVLKRGKSVMYRAYSSNDGVILAMMVITSIAVIVAVLIRKG